MTSYPIINKGATYVDAAAWYPYDKEIIDRMYVESRYDSDDRVELYHFTDDRTKVAVPRNCANSVNEDLREEGVRVNFSSFFLPKNRDQSNVVDQSVNYLQNGISHILVAPTGYGKTYIGAEIVSQIKRKTLIITTKEDCLDQWSDACKNVLGIDADVWRGDQLPSKDSLVTIGLVQSIMKGPERYPKWLFHDYGLVICDEVHRMGAAEFSKAMWHLPAKLRLGLTATPKRQDGKDIVFHAHIGKVIVTAKQDVLPLRVVMKSSSWKVPIVKRGGDYVPMPHTFGRINSLLKSFTQDENRNTLIGQFVIQAYNHDRNIIIFSEAVNHLQKLYTVCAEFGIPTGDIGWYVGLTSGIYKGTTKDKKSQRELATQNRVILATYKMASEATNIPRLDTCVLATPKADVVQIVGRIRRECQGKKDPLVFDLVDTSSHVLTAYAQKRMKWYQSKRFEVYKYN